jgi:hypothetical protein
MKVRRFNAEGVEAFREYIRNAKLVAKDGILAPPVPDELIYGESYSMATSYVMPVPPESFLTKSELATYIDRILPRDRYDEIRIDTGMWTWIAARLFDLITNERRKLKEERAYIAGLTFQEFYRHLILGPYFIYHNAKDDPDRVKILLYDDPTTMNEVMVQFGSYQTLMQNKNLQTVVQRLYYDTERNRIKRGAGGKEAGTPRRLMDFLRQLEINYDLASIDSESFWAMLPSEFNKFK